LRKQEKQEHRGKLQNLDSEPEDAPPIAYTSTRVRKLPDIWETPVSSPSAAIAARSAQGHPLSDSFDFSEQPMSELMEEATPSASQRARKETASVQPVAMPMTSSAFASRPPAVADDLTIGARADASIRPVTVTPKNVHGFRLPPSSLLHRSEDKQIIREEYLREEARTLVEKYAEFDVNGQVVQINPGPVVTTFEFRPDAGVKYSRVTGLSDDLCLAMRAS